jgi:hypothetical protein
MLTRPHRRQRRLIIIERVKAWNIFDPTQQHRLLLSGSVAVAQAGKPCASDIKTLCAGIQPGEGRIKACIKSHLTDLSQTCEDSVLTVAVTGKVCKSDITKLCARGGCGAKSFAGRYPRSGTIRRLECA